MESILTLDVGTLSVRGIVYSLRGERLYSKTYSYSPKYYKDGRVRQAPENWDKGILNVLSGCGEYIAGTNHSVLAISVTSQRASVIPIGDKGNPLSDAIMWQDITTYGQCLSIAERIPEHDVYSITGLRIDPYFSAPKILWMKKNKPEIFNAASKFIGVQDYVIYFLTGKCVTDHSQACRTLLLNVNTKEWDSAMLNACFTDVTKLPELVPPCTNVGPLLSEIAKATGLSKGIPVIIAGGDQQVAAVGMGIIDAGTVEANTGTGSFIITPTDTPVFHPEARTLCSVAAIPWQWVIEAGVLTSGILYNWFAKEFIANGGEDKNEVLDYKKINGLIKKSPPGANGVIALPHFKGSAAPFWNRHAKGVLFNLSLTTTRSDIARALLESIVLEMGANLNLIREILPYDFHEIVVAGGLTNFKLFNQMQADVFNAEVTLPVTSEASSLGALISGMVCLEIHADYQSAFNATQSIENIRFFPDPFSSGLYKKTARLREKLYLTLEASGIYEECFEYARGIGEQSAC